MELNEILELACEEGNLEKVKEAIEKGADPSFDFHVPLIRACENNHVEIVKYLLSILEVDEDDMFEIVISCSVNKSYDAFRELYSNNDFKTHIDTKLESSYVEFKDHIIAEKKTIKEEPKNEIVIVQELPQLLLDDVEYVYGTNATEEMIVNTIFSKIYGKKVVATEASFNKTTHKSKVGKITNSFSCIQKPVLLYKEPNPNYYFGGFLNFSINPDRIIIFRKDGFEFINKYSDEDDNNYAGVVCKAVSDVKIKPSYEKYIRIQTGPLAYDILSYIIKGKINGKRVRISNGTPDKQDNDKLHIVKNSTELVVNGDTEIGNYKQKLVIMNINDTTIFSMYDKYIKVYDNLIVIPNAVYFFDTMETPMRSMSDGVYNHNVIIEILD